MYILEDEIIEELSCRCLNSKTNNYIITNVDDFNIIEKIPDTCSIVFRDDDLNIDTAINIKIDLNEINIHNILTYVLNKLKELKLIDVSFDYELEFNNSLNIRKFESILRNYNKVVQIICINVESLTEEEQMLFNELYYWYGSFYNITSFVHKDFSTYFLNDDRVLDYRENYTKFQLINKDIKENTEVKVKKIDSK